jgi:hypothetical protein
MTLTVSERASEQRSWVRMANQGGRAGVGVFLASRRPFFFFSYTRFLILPLLSCLVWKRLQTEDDRGGETGRPIFVYLCSIWLFWWEGIYLGNGTRSFVKCVLYFILIPDLVRGITPVQIGFIRTPFFIIYFLDILQSNYTFNPLSVWRPKTV